MKIIYNNIIPFKGFAAINLFGLILARKEYGAVSQRTITHESIHTAQMRELGYIGFYIIYLLEWLWHVLAAMAADGILSKWWLKAYKNISFEQEAYLFEDDDLWYLDVREHFAQWR